MSDTLARFPTPSPDRKNSRQRLPMLVVFFDFTRFDAQSERVDDAEIADVMDAHYERIARSLALMGGRVIKFIGDATMAVFPESAVENGVRAIFDIREIEDRAMAQKGWECRLHAKAHFGEVVTGQFGAPGEKRYDVFGRTVNRTAKLKTTGVTISDTLFVRLGADLQRRFRHEPATNTYVAD